MVILYSGPMITIGGAADRIRAGGLVAMPTETVYGLAADATNEDAVASIFTTKGRPGFNPLIVHVGTFAAAKQLTVWNDLATIVTQKFWPGPLTIVLPLKQPTVLAKAVTAGLETVAVRFPAHPVAKALLKTFNGYIAAPSANLSGTLSPTMPEHVETAFGDAIPILNAGHCARGIESTIIDLSREGQWCVLRPGSITESQLKMLIGFSPTQKMEGAITAPGQLTRHYAPKTKLRLNAVNVLPEEGLLAFGPHQYQAAAVENLSETADLAEAATRLFACLHRLDALNLPSIAVVPIPEDGPKKGLSVAINDRLRRAAAR